ncbi:MAG: hypothetical protein J7L55_03020 [Desulfurococcales archaeon]|nr:hypothetical protein [Desulfurococcales archaeon]
MTLKHQHYTVLVLEGGREGRREALRRMAELLRTGAVMLNETCPICGLPLFRLRSGEVVCPVHGPVKVVKSESEAIAATTEAVLDELEKRVIYELSKTLNDISSGDLTFHESYLTIKEALDVLESIRRIKTYRAPPGNVGRTSKS